MNIKNIKDFAAKYTSEQLMAFADELEETGRSSCPDALTTEDPEGLMSDFLQAAEVRCLMETKELALNEALREFSKRVRVVLN